jgi:hypothetical protein
MIQLQQGFAARGMGFKMDLRCKKILNVLVRFGLGSVQSPHPLDC